MRHTFALLGLMGAVLIGAFGMALLGHPSEAAAPTAVEQVAAPPLVLPEDRPPRTRPTEPDAAPVILAEGSRIRVPRLRIDLAIEPGDSARDAGAQSTPTDAAYLLPGGGVPGRLGNSYIYAHARPGLFLALWGVRLGDVVEVSEPAGTVLRYVVTEIHPRVDPSDLRYIAPTDEERLTLQTSTGSWTLSPRFVVVARPTE